MAENEKKTLSEIYQIFPVTQAGDNDKLLIDSSSEQKTGVIKKSDLFKGYVSSGELSNYALKDDIKSFASQEDLNNLKSQIQNLDVIDEIKRSKFDYAEAYLDAESKETVIDFYAGSNPDGEKGEDGLYLNAIDKGTKVHTIRFVGGSGELKAGTLTSKYPSESTIKESETVVIPYTFSTQNMGNATLYVSVVCGSKSKELEFPISRIGAGSINLGVLDKGINLITLWVIDAMGQMTNTVDIKIICGALEISSTFDDNVDFNVYSDITIGVNVSSISDSLMTMFVDIDGFKYTSTVKDGYNTFNFPADRKITGVHPVKISVQAINSDSIVEFISNELTFSVIIMSADVILLSAKNTNIEVEEGQTFELGYRISNTTLTMFKTRVYLDDQLKASNDQAPVGMNYYTCFYEDFPIGNHTVRVTASAVDDTMLTELTFNITIVASTYARKEFITSGLQALFLMNRKTNGDVDRDTLESVVYNSKGQKNVLTLHDYNYNTNGWVNGRLRSNGAAWAEIDMKPFEDNCRSGFTLDISYKSSNMGDDSNSILSCVSSTTGYGINIDSAKYSIKTESNSLSGYYTNDVDTRITFVVNRSSTYLDKWETDETGKLVLKPNPTRERNPMIQVYIDGILSDVAMLSDSGTGANQTYESIINGETILINTDRFKKNFGVSDIKTIAIYNRALEHEEVLNNLIADIDDLKEQKAKYDSNYTTINSELPILYITDTEIGSWSNTTKDNKQYLDVVYNSPNKDKFGPSFTAVAQTAWQGTSSLAYPVKNIKFKFYDYQTDPVTGEAINKNDKNSFKKKKINLYGGKDKGDGYAENVYTLKVDYMDSSHCRNTGTARFTSDILFDGNPNPAKQRDPMTRDAINGVPCMIYINGELIGLGNLNHDKSCFKTLGMETIENTVRWEIKANTDTSEGAFFKNWRIGGTASSVQSDLDDIYKRIETDFEIVFDEDAYVDNTGEYDVTKYYDELGIYHNGTVIGGYRDYAILALARYVQFVSDTTDMDEYRERAPQYFNVDRACRYYLCVMTLGMIDNFAKNTIINMYGDDVWWYSFYDLDSQLSLDNTGLTR